MKNILLWGLFIFIFYYFLFFIDFPLILTWFCLCDCHFENLIANHTWIIIISFKPCFIFIKIEINQTLVSHTHTNIYIYMEKGLQKLIYDVFNSKSHLIPLLLIIIMPQKRWMYIERGLQKLISILYFWKVGLEMLKRWNERLVACQYK